MERYTTLAGETLEYEMPAPAVAAFLARVVDAAHDTRVSESDLIDLVYGTDNPLLRQGVLPGRGLVTKDVFADPVYHVILDLLDVKRVQAGALNPERAQAAYTMTVTEAAEKLGVHPSAVRQAIQARHLDAVKRGGVHLLRPSSVDAYRVVRKPRVRTAPQVGASADAGEARKGAEGAGGVILTDGEREAVIDRRTADELVSSGAAVDEREPALTVRIGSAEGASCRVKVAGGDLLTTGKHGHVLDGQVDGFDRVAVITGGEGRHRYFELEPADEDGEVLFDPFFVRGRFRVVRKENNPRRANEAWKAFQGDER